MTKKTERRIGIKGQLDKRGNGRRKQKIEKKQEGIPHEIRNENENQAKGRRNKGENGEQNNRKRRAAKDRYNKNNTNEGRRKKRTAGKIAESRAVYYLYRLKQYNQIYQTSPPEINADKVKS